MILFWKFLLLNLFWSGALAQSSCNSVSSEKMVELADITNNGYTQISQSVTYNTGTSSSNSAQKGGSESKGESTSSGSSVGGNAGISLFGISFGGSASTNTGSGTSKDQSNNWGSSNSQTSNRDQSQTYQYSCPAWKRCRVTQLVTICGSKETKTNQIMVHHEPIPREDKTPVKVPDARINVPGEVWVVAENLTFAIRSGNWERAETCSGGSRVHGFKLKSQKQRGLTGYLLICAKPNKKGELENTTVIQSGQSQSGTWHVPFLSYSEDTYAVGFVYQTWEDSFGKLYKGNWKLMWEKSDTNMFLPDGTLNIKQHRTRCPQNHEICGIQTMLDNGRNVVTDIGLKCCYHCEPREDYVEVDSFVNQGSSETQHSSSITIGTSNSKDSSSRTNKNSDSSENTQGMHFSGVHKGFEASFGKSSSTGFDWSSSSSAMWNSNESKDIRWSCPPFTKCTLRQLMGFCGSEKVVQTPHKIIAHERLPNYEELMQEYFGGQQGQEEEDEEGQDY